MPKPHASQKKSYSTKQSTINMTNYITSSSDSSAVEPSFDDSNEEIMNEAFPHIGSDGFFGSENSDPDGTNNSDENEEESSDASEENPIAIVLVLSPDAQSFLCCRMCNFHIEHDIVNDYDWCGCFVDVGNVLSFDDFVEIMQRFWYFHSF